ncbi:uncharacterized protein ARMOST_16849 [Armillaria ostoyae]|uniref:CxC2-like cysteine cluster KDZ transposase-associated domain-containing protein n=1 Tax=Armillaria ostoyae TaxID=47428 RepID=A0A284RXC0_ARMOS|nr:uncharacterized protein ARMOST_16849 [Armillaria ostoyae]
MARQKRARSPGFYSHSASVASVLEPSSSGRRTKSQTSLRASVASNVFNHPEDLDTLTRAADAEKFSYLLGDELVDMVQQSRTTDGERDGVRVTAPLKNVIMDNPIGTPWPERHLWRVQDYRGAIPMLNPLHWIEEWNGSFFQHQSLQGLGLRVQLGHELGSTCPCSSPASKDFAVLHSNSIHNVSVDFCACSPATERRQQLLRASWWPATPTDPQTATTFPLLRLFHTLNCQGKMPAFDMWKGLEIMTENCTGRRPPDRYKVLLRTIRQWRHLKQCKHAGHGHDPTGVQGTSLGELALECLACPHPGRNMPEVSEIEEVKRWLYTLFIALDANYRVRNAVVSSDEQDPLLSDGWGYFVEKGPYLEHLHKFVSQEEISTCSGFAATFLANIKNVRGLRTTGVVGCTCTRHGVWWKRAHSYGRHCNVDGVVVQALNDIEVEVVISYDIVCQWGVHFWEHMAEFPDDARLKLTQDAIIMCVPKFHLWAHKPQCHTRFSFNYVRGSGQTHRETIEENWADSNKASAQTKMMGPGARQDTLDNIFRFHNYRIMESFVRAIKEARVHRDDFERFNEGIVSYCGKATTAQWLALVTAWEKDHSWPCPYKATLQGNETLQEVELALAREEHEVAKRAGGVRQLSSLSSFLMSGIQIEETQCILEMEVKALAMGTVYQQLDIQKQQSSLLRKINCFCGLQQVFMPNLHLVLSPSKLRHLDAPSAFNVESIKFFMPSELDDDNQRAHVCTPGVAEMELRMREAESRDSLQRLRSGLRNRTASHLFTVKNVTGQNSMTRNQGILRTIQMNIHANKLRYRYSRNALFRLRGHGPWEDELRLLRDEDIRGLNERLQTEDELHEQQRLRDLGVMDAIGESSTNWNPAQRGDSRRVLSWIWYDSGTKDNTLATMEALRIEWCKAHARMLQWEEEIQLLDEEMRRVISFADWKAQWWSERAELRPDASPELQEGLKASRWNTPSQREYQQNLPVEIILEYQLQEEVVEEEVVDDE